VTEAVPKYGATSLAVIYLMNIGVIATYMPTVIPIQNLNINSTYMLVYIVIIVNIIENKHALK
jgi:hypothetical protein